MAEAIPIQKAASSASRNQKLMKIRSSLTQFSIVAQNHNIVQAKLTQRKESQSRDSEMTTKSQNSSNENNSLELTEVFDKKYQLQSKIGEGTNGIVHRAVKKRTGEIFAVKCFKVEEQHLFELKSTFQILRSLKHDGIVKYEALYIDMNRHCGRLVMEYLDFQPLSEVKLDNEVDLKNVMVQLLHTLSYLHRENIVHRDVKPENILYNPKTKQIKLIDFGIAKKFKKRSVLTDLLTQTGTLFYRAPQMFVSGGYREGVDVWAAGITLYKFLTGKTPFQSQYQKTTIENISKGEINFEQKIKPEIRNLLKKMLAKKSSQRISAKACLEEPWFKNFTASSCGRQDLTKSEILKTPALKIKKRRISETLFTGQQVSQSTRNYLQELHCYDSEWEEEPMSGMTVASRIQ